MNLGLMGKPNASSGNRMSPSQFSVTITPRPSMSWIRRPLSPGVSLGSPSSIKWLDWVRYSYLEDLADVSLMELRMVKGVWGLEPVPVGSDSSCGPDERCESCGADENCGADIIHKKREGNVVGCRRHASHLHVTHICHAQPPRDILSPVPLGACTCALAKPRWSILNMHKYLNIVGVTSSHSIRVQI